MKLIFQHIPKTAGSTLKTLLLSKFPRKNIFNCGEDGVLKDFLTLNQARRDRLSLLIGHIDYGIHARFSAPSAYFTFLREPLERTLSHYYFIKSTPGHRYHRQANQMDLSSFVRSGIRPRMNNCMTRMLSGKEEKYGWLSWSMLDDALENIQKHYFFIGFVEQFDTGVHRLSELLGWKNPRYTTVNVAVNRPRLNELSSDDLETIMEYNELDRVLYQRLCKEDAFAIHQIKNLKSINAMKPRLDINPFYYTTRGA